MKIILLGMVGFLIISMNVNSFAQNSYDPGLTITTDNSNYFDGDTITISGKVSEVVEGVAIIIQIWKGGDMINVAQVNSEPNGDFTHTVIAQGTSWSDGTYVIRASYGQGNIAETIFTFEKLESTEEFTDTTEDFSNTRITIKMDDDAFYLNSPNKIVRASIEIQNYSPSGDGIYFMKVTHLPTQKVMKDFEIYPKASGNDLWSVQVAYPILESDLKFGDQTLFGEFEIHIRTEKTTDTASTAFSIHESQYDIEPEIPVDEDIEPTSVSLEETISEETPQVPVEETISEETPQVPVEETISEFDELNENSEDDLEEQWTIQKDEASVQNLMNILPYLIIIIAVIIGTGIAIKIKNNNDDLSEDYEDDEESEKDILIENASISKKFEDMQDSQSSPTDEAQIDKIIQDKLDIISKLKESKIGENEKLEAIKKSLIENGSFTQDDTDYLEKKYAEYKINKDKT